MVVFECLLLLMLITVAVTAMLQKNILNAVLVFSIFGIINSVVWMLLRSPDLAITEAAVGAGVSTVLLLLTLKRIGELKDK